MGGPSRANSVPHDCADSPAQALHYIRCSRGTHTDLLYPSRTSFHRDAGPYPNRLHELSSSHSPSRMGSILLFCLVGFQRSLPGDCVGFLKLATETTLLLVINCLQTRNVDRLR